MYIRYNSTLKMYEYDTSVGSTGAGPWLLLPLDIKLLDGFPGTTTLFLAGDKIFRTPAPGPNTGLWQNAAFNSANFIAESGTWTVSAGNLLINRYTQIGKTLIWVFATSGASFTGGTTSVLYVKMPASLSGVAYSGMNSVATIINSGGTNSGFVFVDAADPTRLKIVNSRNFTSGGLDVFINMIFEVL